MFRLIGCVSWVFLGCFGIVSVQAEPLRIYIDADFSHSTDAAGAIENGVNTALAEVGYSVAGIALELVPKDNRGNAIRAGHTIRTFSEDPRGLAIIGGVQSPPYLTNREFINENGLLLLLPWSAAGPITRSLPGYRNWIYRLSVDDRKAGPFLVQRALTLKHCTAPSLVLLDSGWGRTNRQSMLEAFGAAGVAPHGVFMFSGALDRNGASELAETVASTDANCIILLASAHQGALLSTEFFKRNKDLKIISHWGLLLGDFIGLVPPDVRNEMSIEVLQTCSLPGHSAETGSEEPDPFVEKAVQAMSGYQAGVGFAHAYDLTRLFLAAIQQAAGDSRWHGSDVTEKRNLISLALDRLKSPVRGILKTYVTPFSPYSVAEPDAHEALGYEDLCFSTYDNGGQLVPLSVSGVSE